MDINVLVGKYVNNIYYSDKYGFWVLKEFIGFVDVGRWVIRWISY